MKLYLTAAMMGAFLLMGAESKAVSGKVTEEFVGCVADKSRSVNLNAMALCRQACIDTYSKDYGVLLKTNDPKCKDSAKGANGCYCNRISQN